MHKRLTTETFQTELKGLYTGYYWLSDARDPVIFKNSDVVDGAVLCQALPYVVEGALCNEQYSYKIRTIDSICYIDRFELSAVQSKHTIAQELPLSKSDIELGQTINILRVYEELENPIDQLTELEAVANVFLGFK